jgi:7-cyano-7-deazaguanine reductase
VTDTTTDEQAAALAAHVATGPPPGEPVFTLLGQQARDPITAAQLETIPAGALLQEVTVDGAELTALCPVTGQPDLYELHIAYEPAGQVIESKALKLYLTSFRNVGIFCEDLAVELLAAVVAATNPAAATVSLRQQVRGGLVLGATAAWPPPETDE